MVGPPREFHHAAAEAVSTLPNGHTIRGFSCRVQQQSIPIFTLFEQMDVPVGDKVRVDYEMPAWARSGHPLVKRAFLRGFLGELQGPARLLYRPILRTVQGCRISRQRPDLAPQVRDLLGEFGIETSCFEATPVNYKRGSTVQTTVRLLGGRDLYPKLASIGYGLNAERSGRLNALLRWQWTDTSPDHFDRSHRLYQADGEMLWDSLAAIEPLGEQTVYDLEVEDDTHLFRGGRNPGIKLYLWNASIRDRRSGVDRLVLPGGDGGQALLHLRRRQADPRHALGQRPDRRLRGAGPNRVGEGAGDQRGRRAVRTRSACWSWSRSWTGTSAGRWPRASPTGGRAISESSSPTSARRAGCSTGRPRSPPPRGSAGCSALIGENRGLFPDSGPARRGRGHRSRDPRRGRSGESLRVFFIRPSGSIGYTWERERVSRSAHLRPGRGPPGGSEVRSMGRRVLVGLGSFLAVLATVAVWPCRPWPWAAGLAAAEAARGRPAADPGRAAPLADRAAGDQRESMIDAESWRSRRSTPRAGCRPAGGAG